MLLKIGQFWTPKRLERFFHNKADQNWIWDCTRFVKRTSLTLLVHSYFATAGGKRLAGDDARSVHL